MEQKLNNIVLVPTDFSDTCQNAINHGAELAKFLDYKLALLHVFNKESKTLLKNDNLSEDDAKASLLKIANEAKSSFGIEVETLTREGSIFKEIHQAASDIGSNLMILGTHGKKGLQHVFGSHALSVIMKSPVPTLVVQQKGFGEGYKKIVFPINDFTEARQQVEWALYISQQFNSEIHIFQQPHKDSSLATKINIVTEQIEEEFKKQGVNYKITIAPKSENYSKHLLNFASEINADMMMIMTDADIFSPDFRAGQWDEKIMFNEDQIPVLCINPKILGQVFYTMLGSGI